MRAGFPRRHSCNPPASPPRCAACPPACRTARTYLNSDDLVTTGTARKSRLGGAGQISIDKYPRVVYAVAVELKKALSFSALGSSQAAAALKRAGLDKDDLNTSMELAEELISAGIEGLLFPSVVVGD